MSNIFEPEIKKNEMHERFRLGMLSGDFEPSPFNVRRYVELVTPLGRDYGIYRGMTRTDDIALWPFVLTHFKYDNPQGAEPKVISRIHEWCDERPFTHRSHNFTLLPMSREIIEETFGIKITEPNRQDQDPRNSQQR